MISYSGIDLLSGQNIYDLQKKFGKVYDVDKANIPERYKSLSLDSLIPELEELKNKVKHYFWDQKQSILLSSSTTGAGKTVLAVVACYAGQHELTKINQYVAKFIDYVDIPSVNSFDKEDIEFWRQTNLRRTWIIDDVQPDKSRLSQNRIENFRIFLKRLYNSNSLFIMTTTMTQPELEKFFGVDISGRIDEMSVYLRSTIKNCRENEFKASNNVDIL